MQSVLIPCQSLLRGGTVVVLSCLRVDADHAALVDEERHRERIAAFNRGRLGNLAGSGVALHARFDVDDLARDELRKADADDLVVEEQRGNFHLVHEKVLLVAHHVGRDTDLLEILVREHVRGAVVIGIRDVALHELRLLELVAGTVAAAHSTTADHIAQLAVVDRLTLAWLGEIEFRDFPRFPVDQKFNALMQFTGADNLAHFCLLLLCCMKNFSELYRKNRLFATSTAYQKGKHLQSMPHRTKLFDHNINATNFFDGGSTIPHTIYDNSANCHRRRFRLAEYICIYLE